MFDSTVKTYNIILISILLFLSETINGQEPLPGDDIYRTVQQYGQAEVSIIYPGFDAMSRLAQDFSVSSCDGKNAVLCLSPLTDSLFIEKKVPYTIVLRDDTKSIYTASSVAEAMQWNSYPTYRQYDSIMHIMAKTYPDLCIIDTIGFSIKGKGIYALKISDNPSLDEDEPKVFLTAAMHGDELAGFVLMMRLAERLASGSNSNDIVSKINSGLEVWINPLSNPDGMYNSGDSILYPTRGNSKGYDLNRNFPDPNISYSQSRQHETIDMMSFLQKHHFALSVNFHAGAEVVNYPWDRWSRLHPDNGWFFDISRRYADTVHLHSASDYMTFLNNGVTNGAVWYSVNGGRQDYVTYSLEGREVTIEIDDTKETPANELETLWNYNQRSFLGYINEALTGVNGYVTDSLTGLPLKAEVFIKSHDADSSQVFSNALTGNYIRFLASGLWNITFKADGYTSYIAKNIIVSDFEITHLDVKLVPVTNSTVENLNITPNPSSGEIEILLPDQFSGGVQISVATVSGNLVAEFKDTYIAGVRINKDLSYLSSGIYIITVKSLTTGAKATGKMVILP